MNPHRPNPEASSATRPEPHHHPILKTAVALGVAAALAAPLQAGERLLLPAVNMARSEAAQLNLSLTDPPDPVRPQSCTATLGFVDGAGTALLDAAGVPVALEVALMPGETRSLTLPASAVFSDPRALRALFRPTVSFADPPDPVMPDPCADVAVSLEVYDVRTGRTSFVMGDPIPTESDPPEPVQPQP